MKKFLIGSLLALALAPFAVQAQSANHEYSPLVEKTVNYKNWKLPEHQNRHRRRSAYADCR